MLSVGLLLTLLAAVSGSDVVNLSSRDFDATIKAWRNMLPMWRLTQRILCRRGLGWWNSTPRCAPDTLLVTRSHSSIAQWCGHCKKLKPVYEKVPRTRIEKYYASRSASLHMVAASRLSLWQAATALKGKMNLAAVSIRA